MYFIVGALMAISILFLFLYGGNFLNLEFEKIERLNQTQITLDETKSIASNATSATKNQTEIIIKQFQRDNNTTNQILKNQNTSLTNQAVMLENMDKAIYQNTVAIEQNNNLSKHIENLSQEHEIVTKEHDKIVVEAQNTTNHVENQLERYGENSIEQFNKLLENQEQILKLLNNNNNKTINNK